MNFWEWFFWGTGGQPGFRKFFNRWLMFHIIIGFCLIWIVPVSLESAAKAFLLPLAGIFVGLSFAWGGNAQALLQTEEIESLTEHHPGGFEDYIYTYQAAILVILCTVTVWSLAALELFDARWPTPNRPIAYFLIGNGLYSLASLTLRECWHVVLAAQWMLLARRRIRQKKSNPK